MKKMFAMLLIAAMTLTGFAAFAENYHNEDLNFTFDKEVFSITEDETEDELETVLTAKNEAWGMTYIRFHLRDLDDGEKFPTKAEFAELEKGLNTEVTQGEWNGFKDVFMYDVKEDGTFESVFIIPVYDDDDDNEIDDILTINVSITDIEDEELAMARDDQISAVLDTLKIDDD